MINYVRYYVNEISWRLAQREDAFYEHERRYAGGVIHTVDDSGDEISRLILSGKPFMAARFGSTESYAMKVLDLKIKSKYDQALFILCNNAGFFPNSMQKAIEFVELMKETCRDVDVIGVWKMFMEKHYIRTCMKPDVYMTYLPWLEPWYSKRPWTGALKGKRVLVIHPFIDTIRSQYQKREFLFPGTEILPEFELNTLKAVQTIAGEKDPRFETWFDALEWMYQEAMKIDFDIAIIGCGAYGFPLAAKLKRAGKQAIHLGGVTQILFGIKGGRWDNVPAVSSLYNDAWVRPGEIEKPKNAKDIEGGCYW